MVLLNSLLLALMYWLLIQFDDQSQAYQQLLQVGLYSLIGVEIALVLLAFWLYKRNRIFKITLTPAQLTLVHPTSDSWTWQVKLNEIREIQHQIDIRKFKTIYFILKDGSRHELCPNYHYPRKKLYEEISSVQPSIKMPTSPYRFKSKPR
jgi:hypothetical protein